MKTLTIYLLLALAAVAAPPLTSGETRMVDAINKYRAKYSLPPLAVDPLLTKLARVRAPYYTHTAFGMWSKDHAHKWGFVGPVSDNLCQGATTPEEAVIDGWGGEDRNDHFALHPKVFRAIGHNYQMRGYMEINNRWIDQHFNRVGVAICGHNYIAVFGRAEN